MRTSDIVGLLEKLRTHHEISGYLPWPGRLRSKPKNKIRGLFLNIICINKSQMSYLYRHKGDLTNLFMRILKRVVDLQVVRFDAGVPRVWRELCKVFGWKKKKPVSQGKRNLYQNLLFFDAGIERNWIRCFVKHLFDTSGIIMRLLRLYERQFLTFDFWFSISLNTVFSKSKYLN